jgi:hypothetical protein
MKSWCCVVSTDVIVLYAMPVNTKIAKIAKNVGRPTGVRHGKPMQMRVDDDFLAMLDGLRKAEPDLPNRTEMIRRLVEAADVRLRAK